MTDPYKVEPGALARAEDALTDLKAGVARVKESLEADGPATTAWHYLQPDDLLMRIERFTRRNPLTALGIALGVGLWINRRR